jgi:hypothetical protein
MGGRKTAAEMIGEILRERRFLSPFSFQWIESSRKTKPSRSGGFGLQLVLSVSLGVGGIVLEVFRSGEER